MVVLTTINSHLMKSYRREDRLLFNLVILTLKVLGCSGLCYVLYIISKLVTVNLVCKHPELTDAKVKYITSMMSKDIHYLN